MKHQTSKELVPLLRRGWLEVTKADVEIKNTTDDQLLLWLASDALVEAEHDLKLAIEYASSLKTATSNQQLALRMQLIAVVMLKKHLALLSRVHPQLFVLPLWVTQVSLMWIGTYWFFFVFHLNYWLVMPFIIFNLVTFPFVMRIPDRHVIWVLDCVKNLANSAHENLLSIEGNN
ncbi:MAG: hypothetical protein K2Y22_06565 [Candidatus Obscuribacterales bacterium]|nr:hypothetical protein [Candidatus Obscuribacterales bacterium]